MTDPRSHAGLSTRTRSKRGLGLLVCVGILVRVLLMLAYPSPMTFHDTQGYQELASMIQQNDFTGFDGFRTPIYPLFMLLCRGNPHAIYVAQMAVGLLTSVLLYLAFGWLAQSEAVGLAAGLAHSLNYSQLLYESNLLTETTTTLLQSISLLLAFRTFARARARGPDPATLIVLGITASLAALERPVSIVLPPLVMVFLVVALVRARVRPRRSAACLGAYLLPALLLIGGWCTFMYRTTGYFRISTLGGMNLTHWSGAYMQEGPPQYAAIESVYVHYREQSGTSAQTIWKAQDDMRRVSGLTSAQLSDVLQKISFAIIEKKPLEYTESVARGWLNFWKPSFLHGESVRDSWLVRCSRMWILALEAAFLLAPLALLLWPRLRANLGDPQLVLFVYCWILCKSVLQAMLIRVENPRYSITVAPWTIGMALFVLFAARRAWAERRAGTPPAPTPSRRQATPDIAEMRN